MIIRADFFLHVDGIYCHLLVHAHKITIQFGQYYSPTFPPSAIFFKCLFCISWAKHKDCAFRYINVVNFIDFQMLNKFWILDINPHHQSSFCLWCIFLLHIVVFDLNFCLEFLYRFTGDPMRGMWFSFLVIALSWFGVVITLAS